MKLFYTLLVTTVLALVVLVALVRESDTDYLVETRPPCIRLPDSRVDPCERRNYWQVRIYPGTSSQSFYGSPPLPIDVNFIYGISWRIGVSERGLYTPQIALRGTVIPRSARCVESRADVGAVGEPRIMDSDSEYVDEECFVEVAVNDYIVGTGPRTLPIGVGWRLSVSTRAPGYGTTRYHDQVVRPFVENMEGYEFVFILARPLNMAWAAWFPIDIWDVQRRDDGTLVALHEWFSLIGRLNDQPSFEHPLADLETMIRDAHLKYSTEHGGRIAGAPDSPKLATDASQSSLLAQLRELGAYDHPGVTPAPAPGYVR